MRVHDTGCTISQKCTKNHTISSRAHKQKENKGSQQRTWNVNNEQKLMIFPRRRGTMCWPAAWQRSQHALRFTFRTYSPFGLGWRVGGVIRRSGRLIGCLVLNVEGRGGRGVGGIISECREAFVVYVRYSRPRCVGCTEKGPGGRRRVGH